MNKLRHPINKEENYKKEKKNTCKLNLLCDQ